MGRNGNAPRFEIGRAYMVEWTDNCGTPAGWVSLEEGDYPTEVPHITSYGTVIGMSDEAIVLAQSYSAGGEAIKRQAMGIVVISLACVTCAREITFPRPGASCRRPG